MVEANQIIPGDGKQVLTKYRGRKPTYTRDAVAQARAMLADGIGATRIAEATGLTRQIVYRLDEAEAASNEADYVQYDPL